jgi:hypothetical protein
MHFATAMTTFVFAAKVNAASLEAEMFNVDRYLSQYGLGDSNYGPQLGPLGNGYPVYAAPERRREPAPHHGGYNHDYEHGHVDYVEETTIIDVPVEYDETEYQIAHNIETEVRTR